MAGGATVTGRRRWCRSRSGSRGLAGWIGRGGLGEGGISQSLSFLSIVRFLLHLRSLLVYVFTLWTWDLESGQSMENRTEGKGRGVLCCAVLMRGCYRRTTEMQTSIADAFQGALFAHLYPHSTIRIGLHVLAQDGSLLAACVNAATLALIDAGVPMVDYVAACTAGSTSSYAGNDESADPLLDLNGTEEQELPFLTVGTLGAGEKVSVLVMETRVQIGRLEGMLAVGVDGCKQVREILDQVVRRRGKKLLRNAAG